MKKEYKKPFLAVESFQLDAAVAGACTQKPFGVAIGHGADNCFELGSGFFGQNCEDMGGTDVTDLDFSSDGYCYQGPNDSLTDFFIGS